jgi:hypothetical protein
MPVNVDWFEARSFRDSGQSVKRPLHCGVTPFCLSNKVYMVDMVNMADIPEAKLDRLYSVRISQHEEAIIDRFTRSQRVLLAEAVRKQLKRILVICPICGETVGHCKPTCPSQSE